MEDHQEGGHGPPLSWRVCRPDTGILDEEIPIKCLDGPLNCCDHLEASRADQRATLVPSHVYISHTTKLVIIYNAVLIVIDRSSKLIRRHLSRSEEECA